MEDLFYREQAICDEAARRASDMTDNQPCGEEYAVLAKEYNRLLRQLRRVVRLADKTADNLQAINMDLMDKVNLDALTGIHNRRYLEETMGRLLSTASRSGGAVSVLMVDVDNFKKFNDTYGHVMGDACLRSIADILTASINRSDDIVARYGGEEFIAILPNTDKEGACLVAERLLENVAALDILHEGNDGMGCVTVSIGVTSGRASHTQSGENYIRRADEALYISKSEGRNRYTYLSF